MFSSCGFFSFFFFLRLFLRLISVVADVYLYFHTWCGLSTNLGRRSETCCTIKSAHNADEERHSMNIDTVIDELMELRAKIYELIMKLR